MIPFDSLRRAEIDGGPEVHKYGADARGQQHVGVHYGYHHEDTHHHHENLHINN